MKKPFLVPDAKIDLSIGTAYVNKLVSVMNWMNKEFPDNFKPFMEKMSSSQMEDKFSLKLTEWEHSYLVLLNLVQNIMTEAEKTGQIEYKEI